jgi:hypothetical protein
MNTSEQTYGADSRRGYVSVTHDYTDQQCARALANQDNPAQFAQDMVRVFRRGRLSPKQRAWLHILAHDVLCPPAESVESVELQGIADMFARRVDAGAKRLVVRIKDDNDRPLVFKLSRDLCRIFVSDGDYPGCYYGFITLQTGAFTPSKEFDQAIIEPMAKFNADPAAVAQHYGHETNQCSFCGLELTDQRSVSVGYGPICAGNWGLPWGARP